MARMSKQNLETLEVALARLEGEVASDKVKEALTGDAKIFLDSWVKPLIAAVIRNGLGYEESRDYAYQSDPYSYHVVNKTAKAQPLSYTADILRIKREIENGTDPKQLRYDDMTSSIRKD